MRARKASIQTAATKVTNMLYLSSGVRLLRSLTNQKFISSNTLENGISPPNKSSALPIVTSTLFLPSSFNFLKSSKELTPPA